MRCLLRVFAGRFIIPPIWKYTTFGNIQLVFFPHGNIEFDNIDLILKRTPAIFLNFREQTDSTDNAPDTIVPCKYTPNHRRVVRGG